MGKITVEDGPEINKSEQRKLHNMQQNANEKMQVRNKSNVA